MKEHINDSRQTEMVTTTIVCGIASIAAIGLRIFARRLAHLQFKADDWWMFVSLVSILDPSTKNEADHVESSYTLVLTFVILLH